MSPSSSQEELIGIFTPPPVEYCRLCGRTERELADGDLIWLAQSGGCPNLLVCTQCADAETLFRYKTSKHE